MVGFVRTASGSDRVLKIKSLVEIQRGFFSCFEGKNKFSELVANAAKGEPQVITKNGTATAVVISFTEYKRLTAKKESLSEFLLNSPLRGIGDELDLTRDKDMGRPTIDFNSSEFIKESGK